MAPSVTLVPVTRENYRAVCCLPVEPGDEGFVAPNAFSLAQAAYEPGFEPYAVMAGSELVGFAMCDKDQKTGDHWVCRLMVARDKRRNGYGRAAMAQILGIDRQRSLPGIYVSFVPENRSAQALYESLGFRDTGKVEDGESVYHLKF